MNTLRETGIPDQRRLREQNDGTGDHYSLVTSLDMSDQDNPDNKTSVRQEFKDEADINNILRKFGYDTFNNDPRFFSETDYTLDLQATIAAAYDLQEAHSNLPADLIELFPDVPSMVNAARNGELSKALTARKEKHVAAEREARINKVLEESDARDKRNAQRRAERAAKRAELEDHDERET